MDIVFLAFEFQRVDEADNAKLGRAKGFLLMSSTPLTRSSYHADADFAALQQARNAALEGTPEGALR